ncbi:CoA transferase [Streptomyces mexicanus]|uniref:CoA transferase n=1 Tax=Streptomyces mexicanus TaxID=178566 RepID=A0A7X1LRE2_9ACTN|nr:CoA transferase [Streptomyces mexicanus]MBC2866527.1 CoA transferase [Streptomyces mexicanus]
MTETAFAWSALGGDPALLRRITVVEREGALGARLPVRESARACVSACALAAAELAARRHGLAEVPAVRVDDGAVATAFTSERHLLVDGRAPVSFAPLSRFWRTGDGWVRTHANYPHHRERLLSALGLSASGLSAGRMPQGRGSQDPVSPGRVSLGAGASEAAGAQAVGAQAAEWNPVEVEAVAAALAERSAFDVEQAVYAAGGLAVALRTPQEWAAHPQGAAVAALPLVERARLDDARARVLPLPPVTGTPLLPAAGLRVLDLTRVIAGPVATRTLALLGADVLRVDTPRLPELPDQHADTGFGKRSAVLDLAADRAAFEDLLAEADVVVTGYRPGALDRFGLTPRALAARRPGLIVAQLSAWGGTGPWAGRRGFDSLVQVATGIAAVEGRPGQPGALPAQALDHGTGYLLAAAVPRALTEQSYEGGSRLVRLSLARTAAWLTAKAPGADADGPGRAVPGRTARTARRARAAQGGGWRCGVGAGGAVRGS